MSDDTASDSAVPAKQRDYRDTLFLPKTDFPMRAGLPKREPGILARWRETDLYGQLRAKAKGRKKYILHDGPPYANGHIHMGTGLNKVLKDIVVRSQQMMGWDANYVPGWDCHGLPIEWKIEEQYRAKGRDKDQVPVNEFRAECREFAEKWIDVQRAEFKRLGVVGDWDNPYKTMDFASEAQIARELMKFATAGRLYRGSKPVMWSVVEKTALAEAEVEYHDVVSDTIWVKFPFISKTLNMIPDEGALLAGSSVIIWTTTPWTIPGNRAISYSSKIDYVLYEVTRAPADNWVKTGEKLILAKSLVSEVMKAARVEAFEQRMPISAQTLKGMKCAHPLRDMGYTFDVPLLEGDHVTAEAGTGFVHTAPGHGREDYDAWVANESALRARNIDTTIPFTVDADGVFTQDAPGFEGKRVLKPNGKKGDANDAVIKALVDAGALIARSRLTHSYPHSWRSKAPVIFRNTPQWFIPMQDGEGEAGLRGTALNAIAETRFVPPAGRRRLAAMVENRPDWVISRQRAWGVPITVFRNLKTEQVIPHGDFENSEKLITRISDAFEKEGADAWFAEGAKERFLDGLVDNLDDWEQVTDILDVWFDSGSTHAFCLEKRPDLSPKRRADGGNDYVLYLEGSDQHRGWFQSSLLESCGTRGRAPFDAVLTHGFVMTDDGRKMSKSLGNDIPPQSVSEQNGADILRLWVASSDYWEDLRIGPEIIKSNVDAYRKLRNTLRFLLGNLSHFDPAKRIEPENMPELERYILHRLAELDAAVRQAYDAFDFKRVTTALFNFAILDLSAFYFDIRKDALYCDPASSTVRLSALSVLDKVFDSLTAWLAPVLCFTMEEAWAARHGDQTGSVHLRQFPAIPATWRNQALADKWAKVRTLRRVVTGALEIERREKRIGSSLEAAPRVFVNNDELMAVMEGIDLAEISITSQASLVEGDAPGGAFRLDDVAGVAVVPGRARGKKCARSWKILPEVGSDPDYPDLSPRDAAAMRERAASAGQ